MAKEMKLNLNELHVKSFETSGNVKGGEQYKSWEQACPFKTRQLPLCDTNTNYDF